MSRLDDSPLRDFVNTGKPHGDHLNRNCSRQTFVPRRSWLAGGCGVCRALPCKLLYLRDRRLSDQMAEIFPESAGAETLSVRNMFQKDSTFGREAEAAHHAHHRGTPY